MKTHLKTHLAKIYKCDREECGKSYQSSQLLNVHKEKHKKKG
jgi:hypothetical protein